MNWTVELGSIIGGIAAVVGTYIGVIKPYFKRRKMAKAEIERKRNEWQSDVSDKLDTVVTTVEKHTKKIEHHDILLRDKESACLLIHTEVKNRFNGIESQISLIREVASSIRNIEDEQHIIKNDVGHIRELFTEKLFNVSERLDRVEDKVLG
jgi:hypothetical protein